MKTTLLALLLVSGNCSLASIQTEPDSVSADLQIEIAVLNNPTCPNKSDGSVAVFVKGGHPPYRFNWNTFPNQYEQTAAGLSCGVYFVEVTDALGNKAFTSVHLEKKSVEERHLWCKNDYLEVFPGSHPASAVSDYLYEIEGRTMGWDELLALQPGIYTSNVLGSDDCTIEKFIIVYQKTKSVI